MVLAVFFEPDASHQVDLTDADLARVFGGASSSWHMLTGIPQRGHSVRSYSSSASIHSRSVASHSVSGV